MSDTSPSCWPSDSCNFTIEDYQKRHEQISAERDALRAQLQQSLYFVRCIGTTRAEDSDVIRKADAFLKSLE
jgi:hypothetical protein